MKSATALSLIVMPHQFGICKFKSTASIPLWVLDSPFFSITKTFDELSIVVLQDIIPPDVKAEVGWSGVGVEGPLDFSLTGILASLVVPLAQAGISIFALSTYDTDYILIKKEQLQEAITVLSTFCSIKNP